MEKVELEQMDWENVKKSCKESIRGALLSLRISRLNLCLALKELKKYGKDETGSETKKNSIVT